MNELKYYLLFNPELKNLDIHELKKKYIDNLKTNEQVTSIDSFFKKYPKFDINIYKKFNNIQSNISNIDALIHYHTKGFYDNLIYSEESFHLKYPYFNIDIIKDKYPDFSEKDNINIFYFWHKNYEEFKNYPPMNKINEKYEYFDLEKYKFFLNIENNDNLEIISDLLLNKKKNIIYSEYTFYKNYPNFDIELYKYIYPDITDDFEIMKLWYYNHQDVINEPEYNNEDDNNDNNNFYNNNIIIKDSIKLAHIFIHLFKIGGGECYLSKFNNYNFTFNETLFINSNYKTYTLFNYNLDIVYYSNYEELNKYLFDYDIIIDHQLYWFEDSITNTAFLNIPPYNIFRITHGVPIHLQNINTYNYYYSIELYNDNNSHVSWNNHIKLYKNIGVKKNNLIRKKIFNTENIDIAIVGRICEDKVPIKFLKLLVRFSDAYRKYKFNFYGLIDDSYAKYFLHEINKCNNIYYHNIIDPNEIHNVYLNNDILLHPSKTEAGATVILEAMSYGLPVIAKNTGGMNNAVGNNDYLCTTENELFEKILKINNSNYHKISSNNILKVLNNNNEKYLFTNLINEIKLIYNYENNTLQIPNIIHYVFSLKKQTEEFPFVYYLSILSNYLINKPDIIYFHYQYLPYGYWWDKALKYIKLNYINTNSLNWGNKKIIKFAHKADKIRLDILLKYGGIYMDIDTITYRHYHHLLRYDFVMGLQEENYGSNNITLYCNAILFAKKNNIFIKKWIEHYEEYFDPNGWCEASVHLPHTILSLLEPHEKKNIKILDKTCFYYPSYNEVDKIFEDTLYENISDNLLTLHYWNSYSYKYYNNITNFHYINTNNSLYSNIMKNIYKIYSSSYNFINQVYKDKKYSNKTIVSNYLNSKNNIFNISIVIVYKESNFNYKDTLYSILNQHFLYYLNIEIIIIDNGTNNFYDLYNNDIEFKNLFIVKNINIKIIELNKIVQNSIAINIGIKYATHDLITLFNFNNIMIKNRLIYQCLLYNKNKINNYNIIYNKYNNDSIIINDKNFLTNYIDDNFPDTNKLTDINIYNVIINKKNIFYFFPNKILKDYVDSDIEMNIIFIFMNILKNNNIYIKNNDISFENINSNYSNLYNKIKVFIIDNINNNHNKNNCLDDLFKKIEETYYNSNINYLEYISDIYNF